MSDERSKAEIFAALPRDERQRMLATLSKADQERLIFNWRFWGRPKQIAPPGDWSNFLYLAGRGAGKSRSAAEWVRSGMCGDTPLTGGRWRSIALVGETAADVRSVMVGDGKATCDPTAGSGIMQVHPKDYLPTYEPSKRRLTWPNGAIATMFNATEPDMLRGANNEAAYCDEICKWQYMTETWDNLELTLRVGRHPQKFVATTPRPTLLLKKIMADPGTITVRGSTFDNASNLAPSALARLKAKYEGTKIGRQELNAEILEEIEGALFQRSIIDANRRTLQEIPCLVRIVVAIDPSISSKEESDECGIVAVGLGSDGHGYLLDDVSGVMSPDAWAAKAVSLYHTRRADRIIAEANQGGDMCEAMIRQKDKNVSFGKVHASRGKYIRAEPISALYERGMIYHVGIFEKLETQMACFTADFDRARSGYSPDRLDAAVWGFTELFEGCMQNRLLFTSA